LPVVAHVAALEAATAVTAAALAAGLVPVGWAEAAARGA
jgi:hypothetical protein